MGSGFKLILGIILSLSGLLACNSYKSKMGKTNEEPISEASINFQFVNAKVFEPHCVRCHSLAGGNKGDVNLETYEQIVSQLRAIEETVFIDQSMPPKRAGGPLPAYEKSVLRLWIDTGAPREAGERPQGNNPGPEPTEPVPEPPLAPVPPATEPEAINPTWDDIYLKIFEPKCVKCHAAGEKAEEYPMTDRAYVVDPANLLLAPGNPEESEIYISVTRQDKRTMPPPKTGVTMTTTEIEAIKLWILNGAKD